MIKLNLVRYNTAGLHCLKARSAVVLARNSRMEVAREI
jgi:hypothetical protein